MRDLMVGSRQGLIRFRQNGRGWTQAGGPDFLAEPVSFFMRDPRDNALYVALKLGHFGCKMHRSDDDGATWQEISVPAYPASDADDAPILQMIWALAAGGPDQPGVIWAGTMPGGLFKSTDRGQSWVLNESLWNQPWREKWFGGGFDWPGIHSILVDPRNPDGLTLGVSCGGVWKTQDGGDSWSQAGQGLRAEFLPPDQAFEPQLQDPHLLAACASDPDRIWCQHHNGMFVSSDGGRNFTELGDVKPACFGFAVAAHPFRPDTAWFAPAVKDECRVPVDGKFVVTRTDDGGASVHALDNGLPDGLSYDLIYRHALVVDETGDNLAMGSTTGNLWTSSNGGQDWQLVSLTLPPIAQVAFI